MPRRAVVVFADRADWRPLRLLKPGFRHCFTALSGEGAWVIYEPMLHRTQVTVHVAAGEVDLARWYRDQGLAVVESAVAEPVRRVLPVRPYTCVEAVKRVLGLRAPWTFTPWQLYRLLQEKAIDTGNKIGI